jgi:ArsR family metal-binding transcriptional regulator
MQYLSIHKGVMNAQHSFDRRLGRCEFRDRAYGKPLSDWREAKEEAWAQGKAAQDERSLRRAILFLKSTVDYVSFQVQLATELLMAFGAMILGILSIMFPRIMFGTPKDIVPQIGIYLILILGGLLYGTGFAILVKVRNENESTLKAIRRIQTYLKEHPKLGDAASVPSTTADTPSDPATQTRADLLLRVSQ